jgi:histidinol-phosphate aminotransferase
MSQFGPEYVRAIAPYQAGKPISEVAREFGLDEASIVKLASNENPFGVPESAKKAMAEAAAELGRYPDANGFELKAALAKRYDVPADWITLGNGSNDILEIAAHAFVQKGQAVVYSQYSFAVYALATQGVGARGIVVPAKDYGHDLDAMAAAIDADTRLVFIANPNNPTGTFIAAAEIEAFLDKVPASVVVVLDEAYNEYLEQKDQFESTQWVRKFPQPDRLAHLLESLWPGRPARRLRDRPAGGDRPDEPHPPALQREFAGPGGRHRRAERQGLPAEGLREQPRRLRSS